MLDSFTDALERAGAAIVYLSCAYVADKKDVRFWLILPTCLVTCVGYIILIAVKESNGAKLFACFLVASASLSRCSDLFSAGC